MKNNEAFHYYKEYLYMHLQFILRVNSIPSTSSKNSSRLMILFIEGANVRHYWLFTITPTSWPKSPHFVQVAKDLFPP